MTLLIIISLLFHASDLNAAHKRKSSENKHASGFAGAKKSRIVIIVSDSDEEEDGEEIQEAILLSKKLALEQTQEREELKKAQTAAQGSDVESKYKIVDNKDLKQADQIFFNAPIIIVPGASNKYTAWYQKSSAFFDAVREQTPQDHKVISFTWNGGITPWNSGITNKEQSDAALQLAELINNLNQEVIIIAHSYGGLIAFGASQLCTTPIKFLFTLGTPHGPRDQKPNMANIGHLYNLTSAGDIITSSIIGRGIAGQGELPTILKQHQNASNLYVKLPVLSLLGQENPDHTQMHSPIIGKNIFLIPRIVKKHQNGLLTFYSDKEPDFDPNPSQPSTLLAITPHKEFLKTAVSSLSRALKLSTKFLKFAKKIVSEEEHIAK